MSRRLPAIDRILSRVHIEVDSGCWAFTGCLVRGGYGQIRIAGVTRYVHVVAHEELIGPIPGGHQVDHLCFNRACVNPAHLEAVPPAVNQARSRPGRRGQNRAHIEKSKTHCPRGHAYDEENTYTSSRGYRWCRACQRARYNDRKKADNGSK